MKETSIVMTKDANPSPIISRKTYDLLCAIQCLLAIGLAFALFFNFFGIAKVPSESMYPTLKIGSKLVYRVVPAEELDYDDIVLFFPFADIDAPIKSGFEVTYRTKVEKETIYVKRVIGLPGDVLEMKDGYVYRNGEKLDPGYIAEEMDTNGKTYTVPEDRIFCMGDNRNYSQDSRVFGAVSYNKFFGKVFYYT